MTRLQPTYTVISRRMYSRLKHSRLQLTPALLPFPSLHCAARVCAAPAYGGPCPTLSTDPPAALRGGRRGPRRAGPVRREREAVRCVCACVRLVCKSAHMRIPRMAVRVPTGQHPPPSARTRARTHTHTLRASRRFLRLDTSALCAAHIISSRRGLRHVCACMCVCVCV